MTAYPAPDCSHWDTFQDDDGTWCDECGCLVAVDSDPTRPHGVPRPTDL